MTQNLLDTTLIELLAVLKFISFLDISENPFLSDNVLQQIAKTCTYLRTLNMQSIGATTAGVETVMENCQYLEKLNCKGSKNIDAARIKLYIKTNQLKVNVIV